MINVSGIDENGIMRMIGIKEGDMKEIETALKEKGWSILQIWKTEDRCLVQPLNERRD